MTPAMPTSALLGALLLARAARDAGALKPVGDAAGDEAPALEKEEWPWRSARKEVGQLLSKMTDSSVHGFGQGMETDDDLDLHDGLPPAAGCYMRMPSGCPKQPMRTQAWRRDKMATERDLDEEGCHQRKQVWERYCGSEDAEMLYVSGQASSGSGELSAVSAPQVDVSALQVDVVRWPWGKKHESTTHESGSDEEVPLGEVVITHAGSFKDEYLYTTRDDDSYGGRVHARMNGSLLHDPQARWNISKVGGNSTAYFITHAGSFKEEYLRASKNDDSRGGRVVHTWIHAANGSMMKDPWARWSISKVGGNYVIAPAVSKDEYLCATQNEDSRGGGRFVHTATGGLPADDPKAWWAVLQVAAAAAVASSGPGELSAVSAPQVDVSALQGDVVWWPWGKKHESTKHEITTHESGSDEEVPLGEVVITHAGAFKDEYLYTTRDDDSHGGRVHAWMNGSLLHDPHARWNISKVGGNSTAYFITQAGSFKEEYLRASKNDDSRGGRVVHTWIHAANGSMMKDPWARWSISKVGGNYVIAPAVSKDEYLCATQNEDSRGGGRFVHTATGGLPADDPKAWWAVLPVAGTRANTDSDLPVGNPTHPGCYMRMLSGCPKRPMKTQVWRHDPWAEEHELDQAGCEERKSVWNRYCEADDAKVLFVPRPPKQ